MKFIGNWVHGEVTGKGIYFDQSGSRFQGIWENDIIFDLKSASWNRDGSAPVALTELEEPVHKKIELEQIFTDGVQSVVKISFPNGDYYEGSLQNNQGQGVYVLSGGKFFRVTLKDGKFTKLQAEVNKKEPKQVEVGESSSQNTGVGSSAK